MRSCGHKKTPTKGGSRYNNAVVTGLKAVTNSNDEVEITWDALNGATGYNVFKKNGKTSAYSYIGTTESNTFIYGTQPELTKCFYFAVRPYIKVNGKTYVGQMCDMYTYKYLGLVGEKLEAPKLTVTCDPDTGKPQLSWEPVPGASGYEVERAKSKTGTYFNISNVAYTSVINKSAEAGTTYYYKVRAKAQAADGSTAYSEYSTIKSVVCDLERPTIKVTNVESSGKPKVSWSAVKNANKYNVYRATKSTGTYKKVKTTTSKSYTDTSATAGKKYYYKVEAVYSSKTSANSALSEYAYKTCKLAAPKLSATNTSAGKPKVTWDAVKGADKYEVYRATSKSGTYKKVTTTSKKYYTDSKASKGKTYYYKVKSVDKDSSAAKSAYSTVVSKKCK